MALVAGCSGSDFSGGAKGSAEKKTISAPPKGSNVTVATPTPSPSISASPTPDPLASNKGQACVKGSSVLAIDLSVAQHQDANSDARGRYSDPPPTSDVAESTVATFNLSSISGNYLPIKRFALDDIAFIVKPTTTIAQVLSCVGSCVGSRTINLPPEAILVYDVGDPNYADGSVDSGATTIYNFQGKAVSLPGGSKSALKDVYGLSNQLIPDDKVGIQDLKNKGFIDASGNVAFKMMHVAHGTGYLVMKFEVKPCSP